MRASRGQASHLRQRKLGSMRRTAVWRVAQLAMSDRPPLTGPVFLTALVELPIPASWSKRRSAAAIVGEIRPTSRPDVDNFLKSGMDAINGIVVADDSLIVKVTVEKKFGVDPKLVLLIEPIEASPSNRGAAL